MSDKSALIPKKYGTGCVAQLSDDLDTAVRAKTCAVEGFVNPGTTTRISQLFVSTSAVVARSCYVVVAFSLSWQRLQYDKPPCLFTEVHCTSQNTHDSNYLFVYGNKYILKL